MFDEEPRRVAAVVERDPEFGVDRLTSAILEFPSGHAIFTCSTQLVYHQRMQFLGTKGRIEMEIPFSAPTDRPCRLFVDDGTDLFGSGIETIEIATSNQYTIQADRFSEAIRHGTPAPVALEDAVANMAVIEAIFRAGASGKWETPDR
jgi:predicted dehydrogenase